MQDVNVIYVYVPSIGYYMPGNLYSWEIHGFIVRYQQMTYEFIFRCKGSGYS